MTTAVDTYCTVLIHSDELGTIKTSDLRTKLDSALVDDKIAALKQVVILALNGESQRNMLMPVIKSCLQCEDELLKKVLLIFWEVCEMTDAQGALLPEMILVCNYIRNDLENPNEYIRGSTLRLLCKIKHPEILESLIPVVTANLHHRHSYVRKNAVLAVFEIYMSFPDLIPDAAEVIFTLLQSETNLQTKRNAFLMLFHCDTNRAVLYLDSCMTSISSTGESFQMVVLELVRKVCRIDPATKSRYIRCIFSLLNSESNTVAYEAANTLLSLSTAPTAVRACISTLALLLSAEADHNVKLIVLDRIEMLHGKHEKLLQESIMDILRTLTTPNLDIRRKTLSIARRLVTSRNANDVVGLLKKEIMSTENSNETLAVEYRTMLVESIYECAVRFPEVANSVVKLLLNFIGDENGNGALDVMYFVRGIIQEYEHLRESILDKLITNFSEIKLSVVYRVALWIMGEFVVDVKLIGRAKQAILESLSPFPFSDAFSTTAAAEGGPGSASAITSPINSAPAVASSRPVILADGTYAQQSEIIPSANVELVLPGQAEATLRSLVMAGDCFLATAICNALTKLVLRESILFGEGSRESNVAVSHGMWVMSSLLRHGLSCSAELAIDEDSIARITRCIRVLLDPTRYRSIFLEHSRLVFVQMLKERRELLDESRNDDAITTGTSQVDDSLGIRQLKNRNALGELGFEDDEADLDKAVGNAVLGDDIPSRLNRVFQLTGFSDPVYAEACITIHQYDIIVDVLIVNQTQRTLQNLAIELSTSGELKLVERPQGLTIAPYASITVQTHIKLSSSESGIIFGNIVYDASGLTERQVVVLHSVYMDIMEYIQPATCSGAEFRAMWAEFEWENKIPVNTDFTDLEKYVDHIISIGNLNCLTERGVLSGGCDFLAVNMYARSIFAEDALMNVSVEKLSNGTISGYVRIRSKTQGIALSLGDRVTSKQRAPVNDLLG